MRIVTWNINGLGSLKFPFRIHAHHTHRYPTADDSQQSPAPATRPLDDYDYDETTTTADSDLSATKQQPSSPSALWSRSVSSASGAGTAVDAAPVSPHDPAFPAFPSRQLILTDALVSSYDELIGYFQADIVCLQEVKIGRGRMDLLAKAAFAAGYDSFFSFCRKRPGYSGVATFTRQDRACPIAAEEGVTGTWPVQSAASSSVPSSSQPPNGVIGHNSALLSCLSAAELRDLDSEGRCVITDHGAFLLFNLYIPNAGEDRNEFKLRYLELLSMRLRQCQAAGREVVVVGDLNIAATRLDHCQPEPFELADGSKVAFEESPSRKWWRDNVTATLTYTSADEQSASADQQPRLVDVLRAEHPSQRKAYTCWNTLTGARSGNYGTRIDHILTSHSVATAAHSSRILSYVHGSDHCPVQCSIDVQRLPGWAVRSVPPALCSQWWPELSGQQKKLSSFFTKLDAAPAAQQAQQHAEHQPEVSTIRVVVAPAAAAAVVEQSKSANTQPKRLADSSLKSVDRKRRKGPAGKALSPPSSASLLSYFSAPAKPTPPSPHPGDIDRAFLTGHANSHANQPEQLHVQNQQRPSFIPVEEPSTPPRITPRSSDGGLLCSDHSLDLPEAGDGSLVAAHSSAASPLSLSISCSALSPPLGRSSPSPPLPASTESCLSPSSSASSASSSDKPSAVSAFSRLFTQSSLEVLCAHSLPAKMWQVNKKGPNHGRQFYCCNVPVPDRCQYWQWLSDIKRQRSRQQQSEQHKQQQTGSVDGAQSQFVSARTVQMQALVR